MSEDILRWGMGNTTKKLTSEFKSFNYLENGRVLFGAIPTIKMKTKLDAGFYSLLRTSDFTNPETILKEVSPNELHDVIQYDFIDKIKETFGKFFDENVKGHVRNLGYNHKLGIILHGKQGTSKTSIMKYFYTDAIINQDALVFYFVNDNALPVLWDFITNIRRGQDNPIFIVLDEFEEFFKRNENEDFFKLIMDGQLSIDNCVFMAATNYIDKIPKTILERPSRFKYSFEVTGLKDVKLIEKFLRDSFIKMGEIVDEKELTAMSAKLKDKTIDELKEVVLDRMMKLENVKTVKRKIGF